MSIFVRMERYVPLPSFIDEINRLFDELVRDPWRRPVQTRRGERRLPESPRQGPVSDWEVEIPVPDGPRGDLIIAIQGRSLTVTVLRETVERVARAGADVSTTDKERFQQSFLLPEGAQVKAIEAQFEDDVLRVRIRLIG